MSRRWYLLAAIFLASCGQPSHELGASVVRSPSTDRAVEVLVVPSGDEGALGGGSAYIVYVVPAGSKPTQEDMLMTWEPTTAKVESIRLVWDAPHRLRIVLKPRGNVMHFTNGISCPIKGSDYYVGVKLEAPFYGG